MACTGRARSGGASSALGLPAKRFEIGGQILRHLERKIITLNVLHVVGQVIDDLGGVVRVQVHAGLVLTRLRAAVLVGVGVTWWMTLALSLIHI